MSNFLSENSTSNSQSDQQTLLIAGRYALIEHYSQSSLCDCYLAEDRRTLDTVGESSYVLLILVNTHFNELAEFEPSLQRVLSEFTGHNSIEPVVTDSGITDSGQHWYATPKYAGELLSQSIKQVGRYGLPVHDTLAVAEKLLYAIKHSPLKDTYGYLEPEAIYVSDNNILLLSAPIAITLKLLTVGNRANKGKLTLHSSFISPEGAMGNPPVSTDDTFSFACIIYQMLNGHLPFVMDSSIEAALKKTEPAAVAKLSSQHWQVLQQGMAFVREQRQSDPDELLFQLNEPVKKPRKFNIKSWGAIAATLLLGATALYAAMQMQQTPQETIVAQAPSPKPDDKKISTDNSSSSSPNPASASDRTNRDDINNGASEKISTDNSSSASSPSTPVADKQTDTNTQLNLAAAESSTAEQTSEMVDSEETNTADLTSPQTINTNTDIAESIEQEAAPASRRDQTNSQVENDSPSEQVSDRQAMIQTQASNNTIPINLQETEEEEQRLLRLQQQRAWEAEQQRRIEEQRRQAAAEEARRLAEQKKREEAEERLRLQRQREWELEQKRRAEEQRRLAEQKESEEAEERLRLQRQREWELEQKQRAEEQRRLAEQKRLAAEKQRQVALRQQQNAPKPKQLEQLAKKPAAYSPRLIKPSPKLRFPDPSAFGPIDTSKQGQANSVCRSIGALSAIGYHPRALKIDGTPYQGGAYYCHFPDAPANEARLIASRPSSGRPQVVDQAKPAWDRPSAFGSVPRTLQSKGNRICRGAGFTRAVGYHPKTFDEQGELMPDGGYLCE